MLDRLRSDWRIRVLILDNIQSLISQIMTQILSGLGLADGIEIDQPSRISIKDQLSIGEITVAEAGRHGRVELRKCECLVDPGVNLRTQFREGPTDGFGLLS